MHLWSSVAGHDAYSKNCSISFVDYNWHLSSSKSVLNVGKNTVLRGIHDNMPLPLSSAVKEVVFLCDILVKCGACYATFGAFNKQYSCITYL